MKKFNFQTAVEKMQNGEAVTNTYQQHSDEIETSFEFFEGVMIFKRDEKPQNKNLTEAELTKPCWFQLK